MTRKLLISIIALSYGVISLQAQTINVSFEKGAKGEYIFYADNQFPIPYTLEVTFSKLTNASGTIMAGIPYETVVRSGKQRIFTLNRVNSGMPIDFQFTRTFLKGEIQAKADTNFVYLLPVSEGNKVKVNKLMSSKEMLSGQKLSASSSGLSFLMEEGDTVYASRSGIVAGIHGSTSTGGNEKDNSAKNNYIEIYHKDSSFAMYRRFRNNGIFVSPGERVIAGQPIGIVGSNDDKPGANLYFRSYYLFKNKDTADGRKASRIVVFTPTFHLAPMNDGKPVFNKLYTAEHPYKYITMEMTKPEKKKFHSRQANRE